MSITTPQPVKICSTYRFSNDKWDSLAVQKLQAGLAEQTTPPEASAALVVGSGGLPYLLSHLDTRRIFDVDLSDDVLSCTRWRLGQLGAHSSWEDYYFAVDAGLSLARTPQRHEYVDEFLTAEQSGLQGNYDRARIAADRTEFTYMRGNLLTIAKDIGSIAAGEGREFTFVNFTNVANYTGEDRVALNGVLDDLPMAADALIIDSTPNLHPGIYTLDEYRAIAS